MGPISAFTAGNYLFPEPITSGTERAIAQASQEERIHADQFHRRMIHRNADAIMRNPNFFETAPPFYRTYFPLTVLWKFTKREGLNETAATLMRYISSTFVKEEELTFFTCFIHEDFTRWQLILSCLFYRTHYKEIPDSLAIAFEKVAHHESFINEDYLTFLVRHIKSGVFSLACGSGNEGLANWLCGLRERVSPAVYKKIVGCFPFYEHLAVCQSLIALKPTSTNSSLLLAAFRYSFKANNPAHWTIIKAIGDVWLTAPFDEFPDFVVELNEKMVARWQKIKLGEILEPILKGAFERGLPEAKNLLQFMTPREKPLNPSDRKLVREWILKINKKNDPLLTYNIYKKLLNHPNFPSFWEVFPLFPFPSWELHLFLVDVERVWPDLSFPIAQQQAHVNYLLYYLVPSPFQEVRMAHFFPDFGWLPSVHVIGSMFQSENASLLFFYWMGQQSKNHLDEIVRLREQLFPILFPMLRIYGDPLRYWQDCFACLKLLLLFPEKTSFTISARDDFTNALNSCFHHYPLWLVSSPQVAYSFILLLNDVLLRHPTLEPKDPINCTKAMESAFLIPDTPSDQLTLIETIAELLAKGFQLHSSCTVAQQLALIASQNYQGKMQLRAALAFMSLQRTGFPLSFAVPQVVPHLLARSIG